MGHKSIEIFYENNFNITDGSYKHKDILKFTKVQHTRDPKSIIVLLERNPISKFTM